MTADDVTSSLAWLRSSHSSNEGGACVEVAATARAVHVRDSKDLARRPFTVGRHGWADFVRYAAGH
ncbi:DUF397 domain-containing protein [Streptomyces sp. t39]|uniref:DUF397 domain-containing protein n=1 Tax=Streptomyces sp. t39 TaxID=1828156 RepID=UPI0011CD6776|nr:DUF397 domain-containing protein [Streptomyces sp. t39]TXS48132.1 DUF397 domain-containing protein [Streptomyces sp. t39]